MKKLTSCLALLLFVLMTFSGCTTFRYRFEDVVVEEIRSIEFFDIQGDETDYQYEEITQEPLYTLEKERYEQFISDLKELSFEIRILMIAPAPQPIFKSAYYIARINFINGDYKLISSGGILTVSAGETVVEADVRIERCDERAWKNLIEGYMTEML